MTVQVHYAGFWRRVGATLIDVVLFTFIAGLLQFVLHGVPPLQPQADAEINVWSVRHLFEQLAMLVVTVVLWVKLLGTPGKLLLSCHVVDARTYGPLNLKQALLRYIAYLASMLPLFAGFVWVACDKRKQALHDKIAHTVVIVESGIETDDEANKSLEQLVKEASQ